MKYEIVGFYKNADRKVVMNLSNGHYIEFYEGLLSEREITDMDIDLLFQKSDQAIDRHELLLEEINYNKRIEERE